MIDSIILAPYYWTLKLRHHMYNNGQKKSFKAEVPTICVGNVTVGGTGKTPHSEMIIRTLQGMPEIKGKNIALLSRGYKRKSRGFQQVVSGDDFKLAGDEPLQIKNKFPEITVAVDNSRVEGCNFLCHPEKVQSEKKARKCIYKDFKPADIIILDDAFQHRALRPDLSIVLIDYSRPVYKDHLMPLGHLRDLPERVSAADIVIISKCPAYLENSEKCKWAESIHLKDYDTESCSGTTTGGRKQHLFFSTITYDSPVSIFPEGDQRYAYSGKAIVFSGIANDTPLVRHLSDTYKIINHLTFGDHHAFSNADIAKINSASKAMPTAIVATTEKDSQRLKGNKNIPESLKTKLFQVPVKAVFLSENEKSIFENLLSSLLREYRFAHVRKPHE